MQGLQLGMKHVLVASCKGYGSHLEAPIAAEMFRACSSRKAAIPILKWRAMFVHAGSFAEAIRDQFLQERSMYFKQLEQSIFENASWAEDCTREHVVNALLALDPEMTDRQVLKQLSICSKWNASECSATCT